MRLLCHDLFLRYNTHGKQRCDHQRQRDRQDNQCVRDKACDDIPDKADGCRNDGIGKLRGNVRHMIALSAGRGHDGGIGNRGAVVAADRACHTGGDADDTERIAEREDA